MDESSKTLYVGLDVHKDAIAVAYAPEERPGASTASRRSAEARGSGPNTSGTTFLVLLDQRWRGPPTSALAAALELEALIT